jgi:hypothetical protein
MSESLEAKKKAEPEKLYEEFEAQDFSVLGASRAD